MKKLGLRIGSLLLAVAMLFVSVGWDVCFHYCTSSHTVTSHFSVGSTDHAKCADDCLEDSHLNHPAATHFDARGCCEDFDSRIQFTDNFTFSPEKQHVFFFHPVAILDFNWSSVSLEVIQVLRQNFSRKRPVFPSGKEMMVFFSCLRLNPLVF